MRDPLRPALALLALAAAALAASAPAVRAQTPDPGLPSLTPRVFVTSGPVRVSLPDLPRQPLTGFGPPPRQYVVPESRPPAEVPFAPDPDGLPPLALAAPGVPPLARPPARTVRAEAGGGTWLARYARLDADLTGEAGRFFVDADLDGLSRSDTRIFTAEDRVRVRAGGQSFATGRLALVADAEAASYTVPALPGEPRRRRVGVGTTLSSEGLGRVGYAAQVGYAATRLTRDDDGTAPAAADRTTESRLDAEARLAVSLVRVDAAGGASGLGSGLGDVRYGAAGVALALGRPDGARLSLGARALATRAGDVVGGGRSRAVGPIVDVGLPLGALRVFAVNDPRLDVRSLADVARLNPLVAPGVLVVPDVLPVDAQAGVEIGRGAARLRAFGLGRYAERQMIFERRGDGLYTESTAGVRVLGLGGDVSVGAPGGLQATAAVELREARLEGGGDVPFYAPLVGRAGVQAPFLRGRARAGLTAEAESRRPADRSGVETAPAWARVGVDARFDVAGPWSLVLRGERLAGPTERWPGLPEAPTTVLLGVRLAR